MVHKIWDYCCGEILVEGSGGETERFINLCHNHDIALWNVRRSGENNVQFNVHLKNIYRLKPYRKKTGIRLKIKERRGVPFVFGEMKKRASFFCGLLLCMALVIFFSSRLWGIEIIGGHVHTKEEMIKQLDEMGIYGGAAMKNIHCGKTEEKIRNRNTDIGWVSVEKRGCVCLVHIKEMQNTSRQKKEKNGHLIADTDGVVVSMVTRNGTPKTRAGKRVKKGQVLIAGVIRVRGDDETVLFGKYTHADGDVVIEHTEEYYDTLKKSCKKKVYTGKTRTIHEFQLGKQKFFFYNPLKYLESYGKCDIIREGGQVGTFVSSRSPFFAYSTEYREVEYQQSVYSKKEAKAILKKRFYAYINANKEKNCICKEMHMAFLDKGDSYCFSGTLIQQKKQSTYRPIKKQGFTKSTKKRKEQ